MMAGSYDSLEGFTHILGPASTSPTSHKVYDYLEGLPHYLLVSPTRLAQFLEPDPSRGPLLYDSLEGFQH